MAMIKLWFRNGDMLLIKADYATKTVDGNYLDLIAMTSKQLTHTVVGTFVIADLRGWQTVDHE